MSKIDNPSSGGSGNPPVSGSIVIRDEGSILGSATELDFVGAGVVALLSGTVATITIPGGGGGGGGGIGLFFTEDGVPLGTGVRLDSGYGLDLSISGTTVRMDVRPPISGSIILRDEGNLLGSVREMNFVGPGVSASQAAGVATISVPGPGVDQIGLLFTEDGVPLGTGVRLDTGYGLDISISGTTVRFDVRPPVSGTVVLSDEGTILGSAQRLNFIGPGVSASVAGGVGTVAIPGPGVDQIGFFATDDGVPLGTGTRLESGYGIDASLSGTVLEILVETPVTGSVAIRDEGVTQGSAPILDFVGAGVTAVVGGGIATITIPGGGGGAGAMGLFFTEEGVPIGTGVRLDSGYGLDLSISGTTVLIRARPPITGSVVISDEGVAVGSVLDIDFVGAGVTATMSGTRAQVSIPGAAGASPPVTGTVVVRDEGVTQGSAPILDFVGAGVSAAVAGGIGTITIPGGAGGGAAGRAVLDFGPFPGTTDISVDVTGQAGIISGSTANAWLMAVPTSDHSADEHLLEAIAVYVGAISPGVGFTIYGVHKGGSYDLARAPIREGVLRGQATGRGTRVYGKWTVGWSWV